MTTFSLDRAELLIGRDERCEIRLSDDEVSRRHARVHLEAGVWHIEDCGSTNGVRVSGQRVQGASLSGGEVIRIGSSFLRFFSTGLGADRAIVHLSEGALVGGPSLGQVLDVLLKASSSDLSVLIMGETGTGKELAARQLHEAGDRRAGPFVAVNCAAIPSEVFESEVFGHVRGAFTGALADRLGVLREASGGTLFLDEIAEMPLESQGKLLRVLQEHEVRPLGGSRSIPVDVRVVSACNRDLEVLVRQGKVRPDLYARVAELVVRLPPLRHRVEDVPLLAEHFLEKHGAGRSVTLSAGAVEMLCCQPWPYNIRGLESAVRRALLLAGDEGLLEPCHFTGLEPVHSSEGVAAPPRAADGGGSDGALRRVVFQAPPQEELLRKQARELEDLLRRHSGDVDLAAAELGIGRSQLYRRAQKLGIRVAFFRK